MKAFDVVDNRNIISKLSQYGFSLRLIIFFQSYLISRMPFPNCYGYISDEFVVLYRGTAEFIFGSFFFHSHIIVIMSRALAVNYLSYADDFKIYSIKSRKYGMTLQVVLYRVNIWYADNNLL